METMETIAADVADLYGLGTGPWTIRPVARGAPGQIRKLSGGGASWAVKEMSAGTGRRLAPGAVRGHRAVTAVTVLAAQTGRQRSRAAARRRRRGSTPRRAV
jgi:hypothetical protein